MNQSSYIFRYFTISLALVLISFQGIFSQSKKDSIDDQHEITIYVISSVGPINWENPSILFKSTNLCYLKAILRKNFYVIGHAQARLKTSLLPSPRYVAMTGAIQTEKVKIVLGEKVGLGSLGYTIKGKIQNEEDIKKGIELYKKRNMVSYIKFKIDEEAARRINSFIDYYGTKNKYGFAPCDYYNGALWPGYETEGSGCSAFAMTLLDVANILPPESNEWLINVNIPTKLIGGKAINNKKIKFSSILKTKNWHDGNGTDGIDFVNYTVYDPSVMKDWIMKKRNQNDSIFQPDEENGLKGLVVDKRKMTYDINEPVVKQRTDTTFFVKHYFNLIKNTHPLK